jgi:hypothetical protein
MKRVLGIIAFLLCAVGAHAQGAPIYLDWVANPVGAPKAGATISICTHPANGVPCTNYASVFRDLALTVPINQSTTPIVTDSHGNVPNDFIAAGIYDYTISGAGITSPQGPLVFSAGGPTGPAGPQGPTGATGATGTITANTGATIGGNALFKGPIPWADITQYGARILAGGFPQYTGSCNGTNQITTLSNANTLGVGDGITIVGCGSATGLSAPTGLQVLPAITWGLTGTESPLTTVAAGSTTYKYSVVARTAQGGLSAAGTPVTITTGLSSLGLQNATISTITRASDVVTVTTTAPTNIVVGTLVFLNATNSAQFAGWYNVSTIVSSSQFTIENTPVDTRAQGWLKGDTASSSGGGTVSWYQMNFLSWVPVSGAWSYYVCQNVSGTWSVIGQTKPTGPVSGYVDASFEDYGATYNANQQFPAYITSSICTGTGTPNPLTGNITNVDNTGLIYTLDVSASQTASNQRLVYDAAPSITKAANAVKASTGIGGVVYIPPSGQFGFPINSYLQLPAGITVLQSGILVAYETITVTENVNWIGDWGNGGTPQFGLSNGAPIFGEGSSPVVYVQGTGQNGDLFRNIDFFGPNANGGTILVGDNAGDINFDYCEFNTVGTGNDVTGMTVVVRSTVQTEDKWFFNKDLFATGPNQTTNASWHPAFWVAPPQLGENGGIEIYASHLEWERRGWGVGGGGVNQVTSLSPVTFAAGGFGNAVMNIQQSYRQGGITPMIAAMVWSPGSDITLSDIWQDTEGQPLFAALYPANTQPVLGPNIKAHFVTGGAGTPLVTGLRPMSLETDSNWNNAAEISNRDLEFDSVGQVTFTASPFFNASSVPQVGSMKIWGKPINLVGGYSLFANLPQPTSVAGTPSSGGSIPAGTWFYAVAAIGADLGETALSYPSAAVTTSASGEVALTWTGVIGAYSYNVYRCSGTSCVSADGTNPGPGPWSRMAFHNVGTTYTDSAATGVVLSAPPTITATGSTIMNNTGVYAPFFEAPPITVSALPGAAAGNAGQVRRVTDSTIVSSEGQTCTGGSTNAALAFSNGSVWKCF